MIDDGCDGCDLVKQCYQETTAVWALKDPESGNLDRVQIIKGWFERGYACEKVYDVVWSDADKRKVGEDGKVPAVGNTVDIKSATADDILSLIGKNTFTDRTG